MSRYDKDTKYYWLQLQEDFFDEDAIDWLESQKNGKEYTLFYLKLCLKSLKTNGILIRNVGKMLIPYDNEKLAQITKTSLDTVIVAMELLKNIGLIEILENGELYITQVENMIGWQSKGAFKKQQQRLVNSSKNKELPFSEKEAKNDEKMGGVDKCPPEKEKEKEKEKEIEYVESDLKNQSLSLEPEIELPLKDGSNAKIFKPEIDGYKVLYKDVDILQELLKMKGWLNANPTRRKTKQGINRFINSWLVRCQDKYTMQKTKPKDIMPVYDDSNNHKYEANDNDILDILKT